MAFQIVLHAFNTVFGNIVDALRVSVVPTILFCVIAFGVFVLFGPSYPELSLLMRGQDQAIVDGVSADAALRFSLIIFVLMFVLIFFFAWIAVAWHRFVLLEEYPQTVPQFRDRPIAAYAGKSFGIALIAVLIALVAVIVGGIVAAIAGPMIIAVVNFGTAVLLSYVWLRFAISLPGTAVDKPMTLRQAWAISKPLDTQLIGISLILMAIGFVSGIVLSPIYSVMPIVAVALDLIVNWVIMMLGISILTTLYGHLVEGRDLT